MSAPTPLRALRALLLVLVVSGPLTRVPSASGAPLESGDSAFLPDTAWLLRVGPRTTRVSDFVEAWFASYVEFRPPSDSTGRVQFLSSIRDKEVMGLTALALDPPLTFEQRAIMREHTQRVLANALYQRMVLDSVEVTEAEVQALWEQDRYQQRFRQILFDDRPTAERVRRELILGRIRWRDAVRQYDRTPGRTDPDGDVGWRSRGQLQPELAFQVFHLQPGQSSEVVEDRQGFHIIQSVERKPQTAPTYSAAARALRWQLSDYRKGVIADRFQRRLADDVGFVVDTANVAFASSRFKASIRFNQESLAPSFEIEGSVPEFAPEDTGRVLARWNGGVMTLRRVLARYSELSPLMRPSLNSPEAMASYVRSASLEPAFADHARRLGLDRAPDVLAGIERRKEQLLVEQMFRDSVTAWVRVSREDERKYYEEHQHEYVTFPHVRFAAIERHDRAAADSLVKALMAGASAAEVLRQDSIRTGRAVGSIQERRKDQVGPYHKVLFEELRQGQATLVGPDREGHFAVLQSLEHDSGRQLSFAEAQGYVSESLQNIAADRLLRGMISRLEKRYPFAWRPELVMKIRLVDPITE